MTRAIHIMNAEVKTILSWQKFRVKVNRYFIFSVFKFNIFFFNIKRGSVRDAIFKGANRKIYNCIFNIAVYLYF